MYILKDIDGFYFEPEEEIQSWFTYEDFKNGKPIKLTEDLVRYKNDNPSVDIKTLMNVCFYNGGDVTWYVSDNPVNISLEQQEKIDKIFQLETMLNQLKAENGLL